MASSSSSSTSTLSLIIIFFLLLNGAPAVKGTLLCVPVLTPLLPCLSSFSSTIGLEKPTSLCCAGVASASALAKTLPGKLLVCQCLKNLTQALPMITPQKANYATSQCGSFLGQLVFPEANAKCIK